MLFCNQERFTKYNGSSPLEKGIGYMRKKGETGERDRAKPQPRKKKEREEARKQKKLARDERQQSRQA